MAPTSKNLAIYIGDTYRLRVTIVESGPPVAGVRAPIDVTGRTYAAQIRPSAESDEVIHEFVIDTTEAAAGVITLAMTADETAALDPVAAVWDLQETMGAEVTTYARGNVLITRDVTRIAPVAVGKPSPPEALVPMPVT